MMGVTFFNEGEDGVHLWFGGGHSGDPYVDCYVDHYTTAG